MAVEPWIGAQGWISPTAWNWRLGLDLDAGESPATWTGRVPLCAYYRWQAAAQ